MRASVATASTGKSPVADSPESMTQSAPSSTALATSVASGARGLAAMGHRLQHLRGDDHRLPQAHRLANECLLQDGDVLDRHLNAQVAAGHHDAVGRGEDFIDMLQGPRAFDLGQDEWIAAERTGRLAHGLDVGRRFHERLADGVHPMGEGELAGTRGRAR